MIGRVIEWSAKHPLTVFGIVAALGGWAVHTVRQTPLDAVPDLTDPQVIVFTEWMGRSPDLIEDQVTYPLVSALQSTPGGVRTVRGYSMFGMSFVYVIFDEGTDLYWARSRVLEQLPRVELPPGATPILGPDATGIGWVYQYALVDDSGEHDLAELRSLQDFTIRPALQAVDGVSEVASRGGVPRRCQVFVDPERLASFGISVGDVSRAVSDANSEVGARVLELAGREYVLRGRGYVRSLSDVEQSVLAIGGGGTPIRVRDVARVTFGPDIRRGAADLNGEGEHTGGIVVMRMGSNALDVIEGIEARIAELSLPEGVRIVTTYDRSTLIRGSVGTLTTTLIEEGILVALVCLVFLFHARSALIATIVMPASVLLAFIPMYYLGLTSNIMSLGGIAIAIGELADASIVLIENAHVRLAEAGPDADRKSIVIAAAKEVGVPIFFSLLLITVSFVPIFTLVGPAGRLFQPLAFTKTFAMLIASILSITLAPPLMVLLLRGQIRTERQNPVSRGLSRLYAPIARACVRGRWIVLGLALALLAGTVPIAARLGSEFMPPLDEGSLLVMPVTFPGISIEEARRVLGMQDRILASFGEVASVHGKAGRAETPTDPAQLDMIETVVELRPRDEWPLVTVERWWSGWPSWTHAPLRWLWPDRRARTTDELADALGQAVATPGYQIAVAPPIRTRIDMLSTGVRTPVGIKVYGESLAEIERLSIELEGLLRQVPGTRSTFAERQTGREYVDVTPDREAIARYGLTVREVHDVLEAAVGGMNVSTIIDGRARYSMNVRLGADHRADVGALRAILVPVRTSAAVAEPATGAGGTSPVGRAGAGLDAVSVAGPDGAASAGMGGMGAGGPAGPDPSGMADTGDYAAAFRPERATVPLSALADVRVVPGPPMIKDEDGVLVGYVFADIDLAQRDLGGWVDDAKRLVRERVTVPPGYRLAWTGQYELMEQMELRMMWVVPITLLLIVILLRLSMRGWAQTWLVLSSLPFAVVGSVWLLAAQRYNVSTAVWVGFIAVGGVAAETGTVMIVYLDEAIDRTLRVIARPTPKDLDDAIVEGASKRARPLVMTVATTVLGLLPLLWESGPGADVSARTAAPVVGGLWSCMLLTLLVLPAIYAIWRRRQLARGVLTSRSE
ncbi:MAG: efflux RND transporter permease subunit [Sandaracinaceae bacterium]|nr:efflux RND transporter permease subunit [Sandaracinaceae bacterium]